MGSSGLEIILGYLGILVDLGLILLGLVFFKDGTNLFFGSKGCGF